MTWPPFPFFFQIEPSTSSYQLACFAQHHITYLVALIGFRSVKFCREASLDDGPHKNNKWTGTAASLQMLFAPCFYVAPCSCCYVSSSGFWFCSHFPMVLQNIAIYRIVTLALFYVSYHQIRADTLPYFLGVEVARGPTIWYYHDIVILGVAKLYTAIFSRFEL